jgi:hypothetical protein
MALEFDSALYHCIVSVAPQIADPELLCMKQPAYSPDISLCNVFLFGDIKMQPCFRKSMTIYYRRYIWNL